VRRVSAIVSPTLLEKLGTDSDERHYGEVDIPRADSLTKTRAVCENCGCGRGHFGAAFEESRQELAERPPETEARRWTLTFCERSTVASMR
jgi:ribosomal protein S14